MKIFFLHGLYGSINDDDKLSMLIKAGNLTQEWIVYYSERGQKHSVVKFYSEVEACNYYLKRMINSKRNNT